MLHRTLSPCLRAAAVAGLLALLALPGAARAQQVVAPLMPLVTPLVGGELVGPTGPMVMSSFVPLRLSLTSELFPQAPLFSGCESRQDASGNAVRGYAVQRYSFVQLAPQLVLHGFSTAGCAVDSGMGAGLTYTLPLRKDLWLVSSGGIYALPTPGGDTTPAFTGGARVDLVKDMGRGHTLSVGVGARLSSGQFNSLNFGGNF